MMRRRHRNEPAPSVDVVADIDPIAVLGVVVHPMSAERLITTVEAVTNSGRVGFVANHNLHSAYNIRRSPGMAAFYDMADVVHVDGMGVIAAARASGHDVGRKHRNTYIDFIWPLLQRASDSHWRVYLLGASADSVQDAIKSINYELPTLEIEGHHGYFDDRSNSDDSIDVIKELHAFSPDLVLVGMGMPRQETWLAEHAEILPAACYMNAGACFDYISGHAYTPPRWLGRLGFEWVARLVREPKRLWRRYLLYPWALAPHFAKDVLRARFGRRQLGARRPSG